MAGGQHSWWVAITNTCIQCGEFHSSFFSITWMQQQKRSMHCCCNWSNYASAGDDKIMSQHVNTRCKCECCMSNEVMVPSTELRDLNLCQIPTIDRKLRTVIYTKAKNSKNAKQCKCIQMLQLIYCLTCWILLHAVINDKQQRSSCF